MRTLVLGFTGWVCMSVAGLAQAQDLTIATVTRPPFSFTENGVDTGFSIDLWREVAELLDRDFTIRRVDQFGEMLDLARTGQVDAAVANISITADREIAMDFSQPIFESGLQIMVPTESTGTVSLASALLSREVLMAILAAFAVLFLGGMAMWWFERRAQPYFERPAKEAMFPSFWWALNLVVNGGFEERVPRTWPGRIFAVLLVVSSLFVVSIFVAKITAVLTVSALQSNVNSVNDLYGKQVGTLGGSTAARFLDDRNIRFAAFSGLDEMLSDFEEGTLDAVVFDVPILAYYAKNSNGYAHLTGAVFQKENYGIALPSGSALAEPINQALLRLRENGIYGQLRRKWFGEAN
ncbi:MAG: transporter substrate-binding domain-containing protein [Paracoccaceae bacterium]|nr:transporter substrate-binding domain-containing protein [Paracoccaceae bacterium]